MPIGACMPKRIDPALIPETPNLDFEIQFWNAGITHIAGIDEAGRGALAGPVTAAAVILPTNKEIILQLSGVRDSKQMTSAQRTTWAQTIRETALAFSVGLASPDEIDRMNIVPATRLAMMRALKSLCITPEHLLLDYIFMPENAIPQTSLIKGDARSLSIAAASILAKTSRDTLMIKLDEQYPGYGLAGHKGYGTAIHRGAIEQLGPSPIHRISFAPMRHWVSPPGENYA